MSRVSREVDGVPPFPPLLLSFPPSPRGWGAMMFRRDVERPSISCRQRRPCARRLYKGSVYEAPYERIRSIIRLREGSLTSFLLLTHHGGDLLLVALHLAAGLGVLALLRGGKTRGRR